MTENSTKNPSNSTPSNNKPEEQIPPKIPIEEQKELITEDPSITTNIQMQKIDKKKKRKTIKVRAFCGKCYQFFENGPSSKICRSHLEKDCNLILCQKINGNSQNGVNPCIRKFPNINSANRHTHCLTENDVKDWDPKYEIQKCLGTKREPENKISDQPQKNNNNINNKNNEINYEKLNDIHNNINNNNDLFGKNIFHESDLNLSYKHNCNNFNSIHRESFSNNNIFLNNNLNSFYHDDSNYFSNISNNNVGGLIDGIDQLNFRDDDSDIQNILKEEEGVKNKEIDKSKEKNKENENDNNNFCSNSQSIDEFFEKVQKETNIPNNIKKKLLVAFKKKGINNVKILKLFYQKYKNWDFLIEQFKTVSSQIEGVALCIEFLLKIN